MTGIALDSRKVEQGNCFLAVPGHDSDGRQFIASALAQQAACVLAEAEGFDDSAFADQPVLPVADLKSHMGAIASQYYGNPSHNMGLVAITGTNGKTSVSQLIAGAIEHLGKRCGVIGTLGNGLYGQLAATLNTTPDVVTINRLLQQNLEQGAEYTAMEASSHGLAQGRMDGLQIHTAVVTNISRDHLDYHGSMPAYIAAKRLLATHSQLSNLVLNWDDPEVAAFANETADDVAIWSCSLVPQSNALVVADTPTFHQAGIELPIRYQQQRAVLKSSLLAEFNASNLLLSLTSLLALGFEFQDSVAALSTVKAVPGRMERLSRDASAPLVVIDFAHTPDALEKALTALRAHCQGQLWCVFGCGGDRDKGKRPLMAEVVAQFADELVLTADNPRSEKVNAIIADMVKGIPEGVAFQVVEDRREAINQTIACANAQDVILIAGKGHESYQEIAGVKHPYSDHEVARLAAIKRRERG